MPLYRDLAEQFSQLHLLRRLYVHKTMPEHDLHMGQLPVLEYVMEHDGCTQVEIAQALSVSAASIATSTKRLQRAGLLEKKGDEENLRIKRLSATPEGIERSLRCRDTFDELDRRTYGGLSEEELLQLYRLLARVNINIASAINTEWAGGSPSMPTLINALEQVHPHGPGGPHRRACPHQCDDLQEDR